MKQLIIFCTFIILTLDVFALTISRPLGRDPRLRVMTYNPDDVFKFTGYYGYQASIELARDEEIVSISMGDTTSWQIVPAGHRIFIKPMEPDATTNMTLITNKRTYFFELYAAETLDMRDPEMVFNVKFLYPDDENDNMSGHMQTFSAALASPDLTHPEKYNFNYYISGSEEIAPIKIFDDGEFTYLQFRDKNAEISGIFAVDASLRESLVNYRLAQDNPNMVILEQVFPKLAIRKGKKVTCVFNQSFKAY
ncbi:P-type conjugative transfer protein VirB9 [Rickettsia sp. R2]|uniref:P-type conjugative transfer protein VirB9 n=1 Tax=Rickettsia koreansis TaxID=2358204 RepID=UPI003979F2D4